MRIFRSRKALEKWRKELPRSMALGFVPTMGALHEGHLSLVRKARKQNKRVVVSLFVNPTQFGPKEDFSKYPRAEKRDLAFLLGAKVDAVFIPTVKQIYLKGPETEVLPRTELSTILEGRFRPGHFKGVATIVMKLLQLIQPRRVYFGEKDFQQVRVIETMVEDFFLPVDVIRCKTYREKNGLAMSSRNLYLSEKDRARASVLYRALRFSNSTAEAKRLLKKNGFKVQYLEVWEKNLTARLHETKGRWLVAAYFEGVRLIDNILRG